MLRFPMLVMAGLLATGLTARAQCPDGTPPPCRARTTPAPAASAPRRADPPLDDATWIVLPFDNLTKSADVDWLRDASVNLLYLDLSKWSDIKVVDDERVADLLRDLAETRTGKQLALSSGIAVAKRAGAGRLVMGDLLKVGNRTTVTAKVFDVRGGQRIRTTRQESTSQDSLMPAFGKLARGILNVDPPSGSNVGTIGTTSTTAYQAYLNGVKALNRFDLKPARQFFADALKQDSTFALAHYKLAVLIGWESPSDPSKGEHAKAAARFSGALPPREKTLVTALVAFDNLEYARACSLYGSLVHADSTDVEALYGMGECLWHDNVVEAVGGDTTQLHYRGSWNSAIRVFRRALEVDPTYHLAFQHILDSYVAEGRAGCLPRDTSALRVVTSVASCVDTYNTAIRRDADSLLLVPVSVRSVTGLTGHVAEARRTNARQENIRKAQEAANEWVAAGPSEPRAVATLGRIQLLLGDLEAGDATLARVRDADLDDNERGRLLAARVELSLKLAREATFVRLIDSIATTRPAGQAGLFTAIGMATMGRMARLDSTIAAQLQLNRAPAAIVPFFRTGPRIMLGILPDSAVAMERTTFDFVAASPVPTARRNATTTIASTLMFGLRLPRTEWPPIDSLPDPRLLASLALSRRDTAALRVAAKMLDSASIATTNAGTPDDGSSLVAIDSYLILGDSSAALNALRNMQTRGMRVTQLFTQVGGGYAFGSFVWPRVLLLRADLEAAKGDRNEARVYYRRFLTLWAKADLEFQPLVERARKSLAALGPG